MVIKFFQIAKDSYLEYLHKLERNTIINCENSNCLKNSEKNNIKNESYDNSFTNINKDSTINNNVNENTNAVKENTNFLSDSNNFLLFSSPTATRCTSLMFNLEKRGLSFLGTKRGASSPNIASSNCEESLFFLNNENKNGNFYPLAKIQREGDFFYNI